MKTIHSKQMAIRAMEDQLALGLGWLSIGLGAAEVLAPGLVAKLIGARPNKGLLRLLGVREIVSGIGILTNRQPSGWLRSRVAGDAMDLAGLGTSLFVKGSQRGRLALTTAAVAGVTALDVMASRRLSRRPGANVTAVHVQRSVLVARTPEALYQFWKDFEKLPQFMTHLTNVTKLDERRSHWVAKAPAGAKAEWDAEIIEDKPNELIAWRSLPGADVEHAGSVRFERARGDRGTLVRVHFQYQPPAGALGATLARLFGEAPEKQVAVDLLRFKQLMETGEMPRTEGQPAGQAHCASTEHDDFASRRA